MEIVQKIADVMIVLQQHTAEGNDNALMLNASYSSINKSPDVTTNDFNDNISKVYKFTRQLVNMIEDWQKLAPWNKIYYVDGEDYMDTMKMELNVLENF